ncbi:nucleotidyltransferase family protein [Dongia deserti]|uniref:nucleotidyltransferase family protein n=1 Tax=Dongia deserti TaxID=2268030 RepID=UPI00254903C1|nr:nucleotidyltransferase family protein [Dongia deserti]
MNALILAGSRGPDDPMAKAAGVSHKALLPVAGVPMLLRVVTAVRATPGIERIHVCIEDARVIAQVPELEALHRAGTLDVVPAAESPAASVAAALRRIDLSQPLLVTTGDHPLLTPAILQRFLEAAPAACDLAVALAPSDVVSAAYPGAIRTFYRLGKRRFSGCNLFLVRSPNAARVAEFWRRMEAHRKRPLRLIWEIGPLALIKVLLGLMDAGQAFAYLSRKAGATIRHVELPIAEAAVDVDKPADLELVERILQR